MCGVMKLYEGYRGIIWGVIGSHRGYRGIK